MTDPSAPSQPDPPPGTPGSDTGREPGLVPNRDGYRLRASTESEDRDHVYIMARPSPVITVRYHKSMVDVEFAPTRFTFNRESYRVPTGEIDWDEDQQYPELSPEVRSENHLSIVREDPFNDSVVLFHNGVEIPIAGFDFNATKKSNILLHNPLGNEPTVEKVEI